MKTSFKYCFLLFIVLYLSGCASSYRSSEGRSPQSGRYYTSAHPTRDISEQLQQIQHSVKRITSTAIYQTYYFDDIFLRENQLKKVDIVKLATRHLTHNRSTAGTSFIIARTDQKAVLLSCAHVVSFPDTIITYVNDGSVIENAVVSTVSIKKNQVNLIYDLPGFRNFEIVARDDLRDLTLLSVNLPENERLYAPPLPVPMGKPKDLRLGSYVMVLGYPEGYPMVTGGIVSDPNRNDYGGFLTDALFNHGISGGLMLATRNDYNSFEWIGVANSTSAEREFQLVPNPMTVETYQPFEPYADTIFVQRKSRIIYGITQAVPVTLVMDFLRENEGKLARLGVDINRIISTN